MVSRKKLKAPGRKAWFFLWSASLLVVVCAAIFVWGWRMGAQAEGAGQGAAESVPSSPEVSMSPEASTFSSASSSASASAREVRRDVVFPEVERGDRGQMETVSRAAVTSLATWDVRDDRGYGEAAARTVPLFTEDLAARVSENAGESVQWDEQAVKKDTFSSPRVMDYDIFSDYKNEVSELSGVSRDGQELRLVQYAVEWNWLGRDGSSWGQEDHVRIYELVMVMDSQDGWSVASYSWRDEVSG